ncbi:FAD-dependent oxidoreductase [uncultured Draconibacterium sp.]|uniref:FAD-dependent oxidoreductase n=1 Tax=uncultured Draconibacterium sp. TaxID=1573823 RepID=UPI003216C2AE
MKQFDVIIIGAGPAGIITGVTAKKAHPNKSMLLFKEEEKGLVPCGIPYIFHTLNNVDKNVMGPKPFIDMGGIVETDSVTNVNIKEKSIQTLSGKEYKYDKLVFATGSKVIIPTFIPGYDLKNVFYIKKSYQYISHLFDELQTKNNIVVVGGGFIGAEVAEQLAMNPGKNVFLIESEEQCFSKAFSKDLSKVATDELRKTKVKVSTSVKVEQINETNGQVSSVLLSTGETIDCDAVIMAIGYRPNTELAKKAGLELNKRGAIKVDSYERTIEPDVCAVGDCSQTLGFLTGRSDYVMLASTATAEARVLGHNLFGVKIRKTFNGTLAVFSTEINHVAMAAAGVNETTAMAANIKILSAEFSDFDTHPDKFEDTKPLTIKLYASACEGSILGGEVWGGKSAGEMINTISLAIQKGVTVFEMISFQIGSHPLLTSAPTKTILIKAAEKIIDQIENMKR